MINEIKVVGHTRGMMQIINASSPALAEFFDNIMEGNHSQAAADLPIAIWEVCGLIEKIERNKK